MGNSQRVPRSVKNLILRIEDHLDSILKINNFSMLHMKQIVVKTQLLIAQADVYFDAPIPLFDDYYNEVPPRFEDIDSDEEITQPLTDETYEKNFTKYMEAAVCYLQMFICD